MSKDKKAAKKKRTAPGSGVWGCWLEKSAGWLMTPDGFVFHTTHKGVAEATAKMAIKWYGKTPDVREILNDGTPGEA